MEEEHKDVDLLALWGDHYLKGPNVVVTKHPLEIRCCTCSDELGHLTCTGCFAVRYCSEKCRRIQWNQHKNVCKRIIQSREKAVVVVASDSGSSFENIEKAREDIEEYTSARENLTSAFARCGEEDGSPLAFRLAVENIDNYDKAHQNYKHMSWMLAAGGMDQEVLNYYRRFTGEWAPRDPWEYFLDKDLGIEDDSYLDKIRLHSKNNSWWFIDFMAISLIKFNRLKKLIVNRQKNDVSWRTFMMGTHLRAGQDSSIKRITQITDKLQLFVTGKPKHIEDRVLKLSAQIQRILTEVHKKNSAIIPSIINKSFISDYYFGGFGLAWNMGAANISYLRKFIQTGEVFNPCHDKYPVDRLEADAKDLDPRQRSGSRDKLFLF